MMTGKICGWWSLFRTLVLALLMLFSVMGCDSLSPLVKEKSAVLVDSATTHLRTSKDLTIHFIDVGQGLSVLIQTPANKNILYDCGGEREGSLEYLQKVGVDQLDFLVVSHPHPESVGDCDRVIHALNPLTILDTGLTSSNMEYKEYADALVDENYYDVRTDTKLPTDPNIQTRLIVPYDTPKGENTKTNDNSILLRIDYGSTSFLLTGECEEECEKDVINDGVNVDVLYFRGSVSDLFLAKTTPEVTIISTGQTPDNSTLEQIKTTKLFRTDQDGTIVLHSDGNKITMKN